MAIGDYRLSLWLNLNMVRSYPFTETGILRSDIPLQLLVDAAIYVPSLFALNDCFIYVSDFVVVPDSVRFIFGLHIGGADNLALGNIWLLRLPRDIQPAMSDEDILSNTLPMVGGLLLSRAALEYPWLYDIGGTFMVGGTTLLPWLTSSQTYKDDRCRLTMIHQRCIHQVHTGVSAIVVGLHRLTGDILLVAGSGVQFQVLGNTVTINTTLAAVTRQEALQQLRQDLGTPITSINGVAPSTAGDLTITGLDCTVVNTYQGGITISNPCSKPCCGLSTDTDLSTALAILEESKNTLNDYYVSLTASVTAMTTKLAMLINNVQ